MSKKEKPNICPKCGGTSWLATSLGAMCKNCGYIKGQAPVEEKDGH
jgi:ribosomal protein S27AE